MRQSFLIYILFFVLFNASAQQKTLLYKNYIDYYSENAKSTILTKDLMFLKNGNYVFKGNGKDFNYLLNNVLHVKHSVIQKNTTNLDTLFLVGKIKDSVKIGQWRLLKKVKSKQSEIYPTFAVTINYHENGKIQFEKSKWNKFETNLLNDRIIIQNRKDYISFRFHKNLNWSNHEYRNEGGWTYYKKSDTIRYFRDKQVVYKTYEKEKHQSTSNLNDYLNTTITFNNKKGGGSLETFIKEKFKNDKLVKVTMEHEFYFEGKEYFGKFVKNTNFSSLISSNFEYFDIKDE